MFWRSYWREGGEVRSSCVIGRNGWSWGEFSNQIFSANFLLSYSLQVFFLWILFIFWPGSWSVSDIWSKDLLITISPTLHLYIGKQKHLLHLKTPMLLRNIAMYICVPFLGESHAQIDRNWVKNYSFMQVWMCLQRAQITQATWHKWSYRRNQLELRKQKEFNSKRYDKVIVSSYWEVL